MRTPSVSAPLAIDEYLYFVGRAFDGMLDAVGELEEREINARPPLPGANSPYVIVHHCVEMAGYWIGHVVAGRPTSRNRDAEFNAAGGLDDLRNQVTDLRRRLADDLAGTDLRSGPRNQPARENQGPRRPLSNTGVLLHVLEELAQHHGQVELTCDLLRHGADR